MTRTHRRLGDSAIYQVMQVVRDEGLEKDGSLFTPGRAVWTEPNFNALHHFFIDQPDLGKNSYVDKLAGQLAGASDEAVQLMAELHYVHFLMPRTISGDRKRSTLVEILGMMDSPVEVPDSLTSALDLGFINPGTYYMTRRDLQIAFLIRFGEAWKADGIPRAQLLSDPWGFKQLVFGLEPGSAYLQREVILHLVHPEAFEAISSRDHKALIVSRFASLVNEPTDDVDRQIQQIRAALTPTFGIDFDFYTPRLKAQWLGGGTGAWDEFVAWAAKFYASPRFEEDERTYKFEAIKPLVECRTALFAGQEWRPLLHAGFRNRNNNLTAWQAHDRFLKWVDRQASTAGTGADAAEAALMLLWSEGPLTERIDGFLDLVPTSEVSGPGARLNIASYLLMAEDASDQPVFKPTPFKRARDLTQSTSPPDSSSPAETYLAALEFLDTFIAEAASRDLVLRDRLDAQGLVWCITNWKPLDEWSSSEKGAFLKYRGGEVVDDDLPLSELAHSLYLDPEYVERVRQLLANKRQVIFHGPPGTGKTFVARKLAEHIAGPNGSVDLVQFHPSYAYEDFVQGYRPVDGAAGFVLRDGPLLRAARRAIDSPQGTHLLIIDEINRGNLAKVLGELYFLLEYRKEEITLQYSDLSFRMPENLWIIGTMNTADRSIALVDGALRRRFYFVPFYPDAAPVKGLLGRWLADIKPEFQWLAAAVDRANELLGDRHASIGPSHFMRADLDADWIEMIWEHAILPYIADQMWGEDHRLAQFDLRRLRGIGGETAEDDDQLANLPD
jgi:hypothetical protein